jgi:uncharacterized phage-like protein YoqJ
MKEKRWKGDFFVMKTIVVTGYRSYELGVFNEKDPKIAIIKNVLKKEIQNYLENGLEWVLTAGNLGVELWTVAVCAELKKDYPELQVGIIFPFEEFGAQWKEAGQLQLSAAKSKADFVEATSHKPYQNPQQLRNHTQFLLEHSGGALLVYDEEFPGKSSYFLRSAKKYQEHNSYEIVQISMDDLQNSVNY